MINFGERLQQLREMRGVTQKEIEEKTGIFQASLSAYEHGRREPNLATIEKLAEAIGVRMIDFFPNENEGQALPAFEDGINPLSKEEKELVEYYREVTHPKEKKAIKDMAKLLAAKRAS